MRRNNKYQALSLAAVIMVICSLTLGYAVVTQTLNINFGATVQSGQTTWNIYFESNGKNPTKIGNAEVGKIDLQNTTLTVTDVILKTKGDAVTYSVNVVNNGEIDAKIGYITINTPTLTGGTAEEQEALASSFITALQYTNGDNVNVNDTLKAKETKEILLTIKLLDNAALPTSNITISNIGCTLTYVESSGTSGGGSGSSGLNEYGFYYNREYRSYADGKTQASAIFYDDGSTYFKYLQMAVEPGSVTYDGNNITIDDGGLITIEGTISDDGLTGVLGNVSVTLTNTNGSTQSAQKIYYGADYTGYNEDGTLLVLNAYADGSAELYIARIIPAGSFIIDNGEVFYATGGQFGIISKNGKQLAMYEENMVFQLVEQDDNSGLNEYGFYYNQKYSGYNLNTSSGPVGETSFIIHEDGTAGYYFNDVLQQTTTYTIEGASLNALGFGLITPVNDGKGMLINAMEVTMILGDAYYEERGVKYAYFPDSQSWSIIDRPLTYADFTLTADNHEMAGVSETGALVIPETFAYGGSSYKTVAIGDGAFANNKDITSLTIPNSVKTIGGLAFVNCNNLTGTLTIPNSVESIALWAFGNTGFSTINIGSGVSLIDTGAFLGMSNLITINVDSNNNNYSSDGEVLYNKDKTTLILYPLGKNVTTYTVKSGVEIIDFESFSENKKITQVILPEGLIKIDKSAFLSASNLKTINIPSTVTTIGDRAFVNTNLTGNIVLPDGIRSIALDAFDGCTNITSVTYKGTTYTSSSRLDQALIAGGVGVNGGWFSNTGLSE